MQRATMGRHFFPFFAENIKKYKYKLPSLQPFIGDLIEDMRLFLIENLWLPAEDGKLKLSIIETVSYERAMELFGNPKQKVFSENEEGQKVQDLVWTVEEGTKLSAKYILTDIAEEMLCTAKNRFENLLNFEYQVLDYSKSLPKGSPDLIISALSIHHLEHYAKQKLFKNIYAALGENGMFINYDQFCSESPETNGKIKEYWTAGIKSSGISEQEYIRWQERKKSDRECSVLQEIRWLKEAGFKTPECIYLNGKFAVIIAKKIGIHDTMKKRDIPELRTCFVRLLLGIRRCKDTSDMN